MVGGWGQFDGGGGGVRYRSSLSAMFFFLSPRLSEGFKKARRAEDFC